MDAPMDPVVESGFDWKRLRIPVIAVTIVIALAGGGLFVSSKVKNGAAKAAAAAADKQKDEKAPVPVNVAVATAAPISSYISSTANLVAENEVKVVSEAEGRLERLMVEEGHFVRQGQSLAMLVRGDAEMVREKARVRAANARVAYARAKEMHGKDLLSQGDYEKTLLEKDVAEQELGEAEWRLAKTTIRAPFSGRITDRMITAGQHVRMGDSLFTITDYDPMIARIFLPERDVLPLKTGREVRLTLRAASDIAFKGRIRQISPVVDTATGTVKVTIEAVNPPDVVRPGAFVAVDIVRETKPSAIRVPREAVIRELRDAHLFVADGKIARRRDIVLGIEEGAFVEVVSGVKPGDQIIVAGQGALKDGSPIKVLPAKRG